MDSSCSNLLVAGGYYGSEATEATVRCGSICHRLVTSSAPLQKFGVERVHLAHQPLEAEISDCELMSGLRHLPRQARIAQEFQQRGRERWGIRRRQKQS